MNQTAADFLTRCFAPAETIAVLLRREVPASTTQRVVALERVLAPRYLGWLSYENINGANVYVAANPLQAGCRTRTKENISEVRHLYLDIDSDGDARLAALQAAGQRPQIETAFLSRLAVAHHAAHLQDRSHIGLAHHGLQRSGGRSKTV